MTSARAEAERDVRQYFPPRHRPFFGIHVFGSVPGDLLRCRCGDEILTWKDMAGREQRSAIGRACPYRPSMHYALTRDEAGLPMALGWRGYW